MHTAKALNDRFLLYYNIIIFSKLDKMNIHGCEFHTSSDTYSLDIIYLCVYYINIIMRAHTIYMYNDDS